MNFHHPIFESKSALLYAYYLRIQIYTFSNHSINSAKFLTTNELKCESATKREAKKTKKKEQAKTRALHFGIVFHLSSLIKEYVQQLT